MRCAVAHREREKFSTCMENKNKIIRQKNENPLVSDTVRPSSPNRLREPPKIQPLPKP